MIKTKKLAFSAVTVRQLTQNMSEEQLRGVGGGAGGTTIVGSGITNDFNLCGQTKTTTIVNPTTGTCDPNACTSTNANRLDLC